jgi:regulator of protease activity HflC (stomatin/prohibitin superfamily)
MNSEAHDVGSGGAHTFVGLFAAVVALGGWGNAGVLGCTLAALGVWALGAALAECTARRWLAIALELTSFIAAGWLCWRVLQAWSAMPAIGALRLTGGLLLVLAVALRFAALFSESLARRHHTSSPLAPLARFLFLYCLVAAVAVFVRLSSGFDALPAIGAFGLASVVILACEALARAALRFYQPRALRSRDSILLSGLLAIVLRGGHPLHALADAIERELGVRLADIWALRFVRERLAVVALGTALLAWAGSCFTAVPTGAHGVRVRLGHFFTPALESGLQAGWPWPFERVVIVPTGAVQEFSLGFERDIGGPILWAEKHFEGEKNLLVGTGEELLTVNVPIYFRIADPVSRLQSEVDALQLGLEIVFVGLKDIHPPVAVASAYQDVISAEEQKEADIYLGRQYAADQVPRAQEEATRLLTSARAAATAKVAAATGEAARFTSLAAAHRENPAVFRQRLKYETLETVLPRPEKIILDRRFSASQGVTLDLRPRDGGNFLDAVPALPANP